MQFIERTEFGLQLVQQVEFPGKLSVPRVTRFFSLFGQPEAQSPQLLRQTTLHRGRNLP